MVFTFFWLCTLFAAPACGSTNNLFSSFRNPPSVSRPKFRYWLPDASVSLDVVKKDIASAGAVGAGGVEFLPFYNYGGELPQYPAGADWSTYGFGTPEFKEVLRAALTAHKDNGLTMDFSFGPNQGQGVPADPNDEGLQWDLIPFKTEMHSNGTWSGSAPGWGTGRLVSLVSATVLSSSNVSFESVNQLTPINVTYERLLLRNETLMEHTDLVDKTTGHVFLEFNRDSTTRRALFAFYEAQTHHRNLNFPTNRSSTIFDNGSFIVDHFSVKGAHTMTKFWEEYLFSDGIEDLIREVGDCSWEDSLEARSNISWSPSLPSLFRETFGYSLTLHLPLIAFRQNNLALQPSQPGSFQCLLDVDEYGIGVENDFRAVLGIAYTQYLDTLRMWTNDRLSLRFSTQPGYNLPVDMLKTIPFVDVPELESLGFGSNIDAYRQFTGAAQLAGRQVISNELGAIFGESFRYPLSTLLFSANLAFAAGVNRMVLHGQAYTGDYFQTTWPGYTAFLYLFSEMWSEKQPVWDNGMKDVMDYMARIQHLMQSATPKVDIAIYSKHAGKNFSTIYTSGDLIDGGWSYNYLSPDNLELLRPSVTDNELRLDGPGYRALVVPTHENLTIQSVQILKGYAEHGLPIIFTGNTSQAWYATAGGGSEAEMQNELQWLLKSKNVYSTNLSGVAQLLSSLSLRPRARTKVKSTWHTFWSHSEDVDYVFVFCNSNSSSGELIVDSEKRPYVFDPWTGLHYPVLIYRKTDSFIHIPLSLTANQTQIIGFSDQLPKPGRILALEHIPSMLMGYTSDTSSTRLHIAHSEASENFMLPDIGALELDGTSVPCPFELKEWILTAEHWEAPQNLSDVETIAAKRSTTHRLATLTSWLDIPELTNTSGVGFYATSFSWPHTNGTADGAYISFPPIVHGLRLLVNDQRVGPLDYAKPTIDISEHLVNGNNKIEAIVPSTMWNYIRSIVWDIQNVGLPPIPAYNERFSGIPMPGKVDNGLVGPVLITPYKTVIL